MAILQISGTINSSFTTSGVLTNAAQGAGDAIFTIDLRPTNPIIIVQDNLDYGVLGWNINDAVAVITLVGPKGKIYKNKDYNSPDIEPGTSRYLNKTITLPLDPLTDYENILKGNYTLAISWYNSTLDEYYSFLKTYQFNFDQPTIANTTVSGPYSGILTSTDTTEYGNDVYQITREHRIKYPTQLDPIPADVVSSNAEIQITPIYTNQWTIDITSFVEYRQTDLLRIYWEGSGEFTHCVYGGCISSMYDAINTMLTTYYDAMACNLGNQEAYQKRLVVVNTAWHLLLDAYWRGDTAEADAQSYVIQEQVEYTGGGICEGATSTEVTPCPAWTGGGVGGTYTFSNGLTEAAGNVVLGGTLTQDTTLIMSGNKVLFTGADAGNSVSLDISASGGILQKSSDGTTEGRVYVTQNLVTLERADLGTPANTRGYEITDTGLIEKGDYKTGYVNRQLVAKDYVDSEIAGISVNTFENGLTLNLGVVTLGGVLTQAETLFTGVDQWIRFQMTGDAGVDFETQANFAGAVLFEDTSSVSLGDVGWQIGATGSWVVTDARATKPGIQYAADYSADWTDHSLVTKKWVTDNFTAGTIITEFTGLSDTPGSYTGFGGYLVMVNGTADGLEFVSGGSWVPATGGTFTGPVTIETNNDRPLILHQVGAGITPGTPEGGTNIIAFQDGDGDEQGAIGIDGSGNVYLNTNVVGGVILANNDLSVVGDVILTGLVDGVDIASWKASYDINKVNWDTAYGWGDHAGLYQPIDADLTAIAALGFTQTAFLTKTAVDTWALDTTVYASKDYVDSLALTYIFRPNVLNVVSSDGYTGTVSDVQYLDYDVIQVEELNANPGWEIRFEYINVTDFNNVFLYLYYHGGAAHEIDVQLYNYNTTGWDTIGTFTDQTGFTIIDIPVALDIDYINGTKESMLRLYHNDTGDLTHYIEVDYAVLRLLPQLGSGGGVTDHGGLTGLLDDDHPQYSLADGTRGLYYIPQGEKNSLLDAGTVGEMSIDDDYLYICTVTGVAGSATWKRTALSQTTSTTGYPQYVYYDSNQETYSAGDGVKKTFDDGTYQLRKRVAGNILYIDVTLTPTGFPGVEDTDWETRVIHTGQNTTWRSGVRSGVFYDDCTITATGFAGPEDTDWEAIHPAVGAGTRTQFREGIRSGKYVIDKALTATGFPGVQDIDWENLETH